jgi:succinate-acetate transporter protein
MAQAATRRSEVVAPAVANPAPLGLSAFALTTFVLSSFNAGLFGKAPSIVLGLAFFYGGLVQLLAGLQEFRAGNTFGATAFCSYGGFWLAVGVTLTPAFNVIGAYGGATDPAFHTAFGYFLLGWTIFTAWMFFGTLRTTLALMAVFLFLALTFLALTLGELGAGAIWVQIGGWLGIITAIIAWYTAMAGVLAANGVFTLPVGPRS